MLLKFCYRPLVIFAALSILAWCACGKSSPSSEERKSFTKKELIAHTWKVNEALLDGIPIPVTPGGVGDLRVTFADTTYSFTFPTGCNQPGGTISSTWHFDESERQVILDRSNIGSPDWSWEILELTVGNLKTSYQAPAPLDCLPTHIFVQTWVVEQ